ncbi:MAG: 1-acyl-sn-glycerol-3-phosphate acyltransferase [Spirochaetaceae bacterium]|jgi:glycerol-3-phosphate O-acyltransferase|nr:1-acyl-sn-glycerol-3-phosphate acyltransferase [Spirochaetaceae bacterium]
METLSGAYRELIKTVMAVSKLSQVVTEANVYQEGDANVLPLVDKLIDDLILPQSGISGMDNLTGLFRQASGGKSCLLLLEHYSNLDLPNFSYLLRKEPDPGPEIGDSLVAIAGMKLNEDNPAVAAFTGAYTRLVIYPSRSLLGLDAEKHKAELIRSNGINRAAMRTLLEIKSRGKLVLVFPAGTRYRPWDPASKKGVREIDSYIKSFDYMCLVAINGNLLHIRQGDMMDDYVYRDVVRYTAGPVVSCAEFRNQIRALAEAGGIEDKKQAVVDAIMENLEKMHQEAEKDREKLLPKQAAAEKNPAT